MSENKLSIELLNDKLAYRPGELVEGVAGWELENPPRYTEVRLYWYTVGKGDEDSGLVDSAKFESPPAVDAQIFRFTLPPGPYSFSGKLISLIWVVELAVHKVKRVHAQTIVVAPEAREIELGAVTSNEEA